MRWPIALDQCVGFFPHTKKKTGLRARWIAIMSHRANTLPNATMSLYPSPLNLSRRAVLLPSCIYLHAPYSTTEQPPTPSQKLVSANPSQLPYLPPFQRTARTRSSLGSVLTRTGLGSRHGVGADIGHGANSWVVMREGGVGGGSDRRGMDK